MKTLKKIISLITIFGLLLVFAGCGGGGGGSSDYTLSPEQLEVATFVDAFAAAIRRENLDETMRHVFANLQYPNLTTKNGYTPLKSRLENLFNKAVVDEFTITNMGVDVAASEDIATVRGLLTLKYSVDGSSKAPLSEEIELYLEKENSRWGIYYFGGYNKLMTTTFPPAL
ncbi:MAG TPA: hypothetical protein DCG57_21045 [Candidatus Riflebacteria bacterium]|jgi:ketosteroid isomerase-like protein|nr:hypothetical protein [Candidatus Riflebacteria bacterium]